MNLGDALMKSGAPLKFNDGTEISKPENLTFMFSALRMYKRIPESEVNREKRDNFLTSSLFCAIT